MLRNRPTIIVLVLALIGTTVGIPSDETMSICVASTPCEAPSADEKKDIRVPEEKDLHPNLPEEVIIIIPQEDQVPEKPLVMDARIGIELAPPIWV